MRIRLRHKIRSKAPFGDVALALASMLMKSSAFQTHNQTPALCLPKPKILVPAQGDFVKKRENVILLGSSGTGKTHIAIALGMAATQAGYQVRFTSAITPSQELLLAQQEYRLPST